MEVLEQVRACLLDALACAGAGIQTAEMRRLVGAMRQLDPSGPGHPLFTPEPTSIWTEAFINATLIHSLDYDDSHKRSKTHPGAPVLSAALAAARWAEADLSDLFAGIVAGYEVSMRLANAVGVAAHRDSGWHATSTCGSIGAAAAVSRVLRMEPDEVASALGNAATQAAGLWAFTNDGAMSKKFHPGHAARAGLTAAVLARNGITGSRVALEAVDGGFFTAFAPGRSEAEWGGVLAGIGAPYWLTEVAFKPYPCCRTAHTAVDAVLSLREGGLRAEDVESVDVYTYRIAVEQCGFHSPVNEVQAAFSTPYLVACALTDGWIGTGHFTAGRVGDSALAELQAKVRVLHDPVIESKFPELWPSRVKVTTTSGAVLQREVDIALGDPLAPMSTEQQLRKLSAGVEPLLGVEGALVLAATVRTLPTHGASTTLWQALDAAASVAAAGYTERIPT